MESSPRRGWTVGAILLAAPVVLFFPALQGKFYDFRDLPTFTIPLYEFARQSLARGELPEWNPAVGLGSPALELYPGNVLLLAAPAASLVSTLLLVHAIIAGLGGWALARDLRCRHETAAIAGLGWAIGGYSVSMWADGPKVLEQAWVPWIAHFLVRLALSRSLVGPSLVAGAAAMAMTAYAREPFLWLHGFALGAAVAIGLLAERATLAQAAWTFTRRAAACAALGVMLSAPILVPYLAFAADSERAGGLSRELAERWSLHPVRALEWIAPGALGDPLHFDAYPGKAWVDEEAHTIPWAISLYPGAAIAVPALLAGRRRAVAWLSACAALALVLALGRHTPVNEWARTVFPPLRLLRYPEKHFLVVSGALGLAAALAWERMLDERRRPWRLPLVAAVLAAPALALAPDALRPSVLAGLAHFGVAIAALTIALAIAHRRPSLAVLVPVVAAADLVVAGERLVTWTDSSALTTPPEMAARAREHSAAAPPARVHVLDGSLLLPELLDDNAATLWGLANFPGHTSFISGNETLLLDRFAGEAGKLLALFDVKWVVMPDAAVLPAMRVRASALGHSLVQLPARPRAFLVDDVRILDDLEGKAELLSPPFVPWRAAVVAPGPTSLAMQPATSGPPGMCKIASYEAKRLRVRCSATRPALMILGDRFASGWTATVDGAAAPIVRADLVLRGVYLPAGEHEIAFAYRSPGLLWGCALGALGAALSAIAIWKTRRASSASAVGTRADEPIPGAPGWSRS